MWTVSTFVISFFIYSFLGYVCEVIFCSIPKKHFVNRGFLFGPYLPIYGSGAMVVIYLLHPFFSSWYLVFIFGIISTSIIEYITSWALEKLFHMKLWDYSNYPLNINGRVCARNSFLFGVLSVVIVYLVNEPVMRFINKIPAVPAEIIALVIVAIMSADTALSVVKLSAFRKAVEELSEAKSEMQEKIKLLKASLSPENFKLYADKLNREYEERKNRYYLNMKRIMNSNPTLSSKSSSLKKALTNAYESVNEHSAKLRELRAEAKAKRKAKKNG